MGGGVLILSREGTCPSRQTPGKLNVGVLHLAPQRDTSEGGCLWHPLPR